MNDKPTKHEGSEAYAQTGRSDLVERLRNRAVYYAAWADDIRALNGTSVDADYSNATADDLRAAAASLTAQDEEIERLRKRNAQIDADNKEGDFAYRQQQIADAYAQDEEPTDPDVPSGALYRGNSVSWTYSKAMNYGKSLGRVWDALAAAGVKPDGKTHCADALAAALTAQAEEIARLTRERDEAQAKERERCAKIVEEETEVITGHAGIIYDENARRAEGRRRNDMSVIDEIAAERARQISVEGWTPEHDNEHADCSLALAAMGYVQAASSAQREISSSLPPPRYWPWDASWWKPKGPRRDLIRAAALIVAEIERIDRAAAPKVGGQP